MDSEGCYWSAMFDGWRVGAFLTAEQLEGTGCRYVVDDSFALAAQI